MFSSTALVAVIIVVALATYITMFNVNSLVYNFGRLYDIKKRRVVRAMKSDDNETWKQKGQRFEVFRPKHENPEPSEWYITLYALLNPAVLLGINRIKTGKLPNTDGPKHPRQFFKDLWFLSLFRRKKKTEDSAINDESWVI